MSATAVFVERHLNHYRTSFYENLRSALDADGVQMRLLTGQASASEKAKRDGVGLPWAESLPTHYIGGENLVWMPTRTKLEPGDLLVVGQENKLLYNLWELYKPRREYRVAFWGHGRNMQSSDPHGWRERFKRKVALRADWWFTYTEVSRQTLLDIGYPANQITVFNNAIDTRRLVADRDSITVFERDTLADRLGIRGKPVGAFLGSLYAHKELDFCLQAAAAVRKTVPDFQWLIIGDGPDKEKVRAMAEQHPWVHWVGARLGREVALYASLADVLLIPGQVGLVALDSFALGKPIVTVENNKHSPEIGYLTNGVDAVMTQHGVDAYANAVAGLVQDRERLHHMQRCCLEKASTYTIEAMVERAREGVLRAIRH